MKSKTQTVVQTDTVETGVGIFDVPLVLLDHGVDAMSKIKRITFFIDQSADPTNETCVPNVPAAPGSESSKLPAAVYDSVPAKKNVVLERRPPFSWPA